MFAAGSAGIFPASVLASATLSRSCDSFYWSTVLRKQGPVPRCACHPRGVSDRAFSRTRSPHSCTCFCSHPSVRTYLSPSVSSHSKPAHTGNFLNGNRYVLHWPLSCHAIFFSSIRHIHIWLLNLDQVTETPFARIRVQARISARAGRMLSAWCLDGCPSSPLDSSGNLVFSSGPE